MDYTVIYMFKPLKSRRQIMVFDVPSDLSESELHDHLQKDIAEQEQCLTSHIRIEHWN